jgi:oxygen-independent coproporphyrinogen-3 oxidase
MMEGVHTVLAAGAGASTKLVDGILSSDEKIYNPKYPFEYLRDCENILKHGQIIKAFYENRYYKK